MTARKRTLKAVPDAPEEPTQADTIWSLPIDQISPSPTQPRADFSKDSLTEMAASITEHGLLEPIIVRPTDEALWAGTARYTLIAGERRWRAAQLAGLTHIDARIRSVTDKEALTLTILENLQRQDLNPIEEAQGFKSLAELAGWTQAEIAKSIGCSQPTIANAIRLLELPVSTLKLVRDRKLSPSHGRALLKYRQAPDLVDAIAAYAAKHPNLTSHDIEQGNWYNLHYQLGESLRQKGLIQPIYPFPHEFEERFAHARIGTNTWDIPEFERATAELAQLRAKKHEEATAKLAAEGKSNHIDIATAEHNTYTRIWDEPPPGCTENCPCRATAININGTTDDVCTDPARYRKLERDARKREETARKSAGQILINDTRQSFIDKLDPTNQRALAYMAYMLLADIGTEHRETGLSAFCRHMPLSGQGLDWSTYRPSLKTMEVLARAKAGDIVRAAILAAVHQDAFRDSTWHALNLAKWLTGELIPQEMDGIDEESNERRPPGPEDPEKYNTFYADEIELGTVDPKEPYTPIEIPTGEEYEEPSHDVRANVTRTSPPPSRDENETQHDPFADENEDGDGDIWMDELADGDDQAPDSFPDEARDDGP